MGYQMRANNIYDLVIYTNKENIVIVAQKSVSENSRNLTRFESQFLTSKVCKEMIYLSMRLDYSSMTIICHRKSRAQAFISVLHCML